MTPEVRETLSRARALLAAPERWTQRADAREKTGYPCDARDVAAVSWCLVGAIGASATDEPKDDVRLSTITVETLYELSSLAFSTLPDYDGLAFYNDAPERTHADVLALLDRALAVEESAP